MGEAGLHGGVLSGCRVFCLFLGVWLPSLPCSGVAWSRLSSTLFIVYLPNEGGGTLRHVIDSNVHAPVTPPNHHHPLHTPVPHSSPPRVNQDFGFLTEMCSEGEGGTFFFTYRCVFVGSVFYLFLIPPLVGRPC